MSYSFSLAIASTLLDADDLVVVQEELQLEVKILKSPTSVEPKVCPLGDGRPVLSVDI